MGLIGVTDDGEWALGRLVDRYAEFRTAAALVHSNPDGFPVAPSDTANLNALVDFVAIAESFSVSRLLALDPDLSDSATSGWKSREREWKRFTDLSDFKDWDALMGYVATRNAIQHGQGRLTTMQLKKFKTEVVAQLDAAKIHRNGDQLVVRAVDVDRSHNTCRDFIAWLDSEAPTPFTNE